MRYRWITAIAIVMFAGSAGFTPGYHQQPEELVDRIKKKLSVVRDYQAEGMLVTDIPFMKLPDSKVTIYYKNPDKFRIKKQEGISVVPRGGVSINLNALFAGDNFTIVPAGKGSVRGMPVTILKLLPLDESSDIVLSTLYVLEKDALILKSATTTRDNGSYEMEFIYGRYATYGLPDKVVFQFNLKEYKLPKGMTFEYEGSEKPARDAATGDGKGKVEIIYSSYTINKGLGDQEF